MTQVTIDFETSHLLFPALIGGVLVLLGLALVIQRRQQIAEAGTYWRENFARMDKPRFLGAIALTVLYFSLMVPVGEWWPNTGLGFLVCSIPFVLFTGLLFMHKRAPRPVAVMVAVALIAPTLVWWLFTDLFFLTLP